MHRYIAIFTIIFCWSGVLSSVLSGDKTTRIVGGNATTIEKYPYTVQVNQNNRLICGGTLVSKRCVLSAAHCFVDRYNQVPNVRVYSIRVGSTTANRGGTLHALSNIVIHNAYNVNNQDADIAILVTTVNVTLGPQVAIAVLPIQGFLVPDNSTVTIVGWGSTSPSQQSVSVTLNEVQVRKINHRQCMLQYMSLRLEVTTNMICAGLFGVGGADACQGDSGGPMIYNGVIVGVTSWGYECGLPYFPGVSARVANFTTFIQNTIATYNAAHTLRSINAAVLTLSLIATRFIVK